ncbi:PREDICTED: polyol transporter 5-like [Tarenaya hassleriana]|uniref:polyol transporter 5-like n=1 Tax=Tarenaya hassleriana TaxID=28532 RepID=UPI00053C15A4|nr:PREDICTED: polyol transporter 5-like [Tarenaya hassleriana]XP_010536005.1 PREDICTED: polyol transporter 5-like [Tarenaya hassleriana]
MEETGSSHAVSGRKKQRVNKYAFACALLASTNSILLGYDIGVMSGASLFIQQTLKLTVTETEVLTGILNVMSLFGSLLSGKTSDLIGRRYTIILASGTFLIGALLMGLAPSFPFLLAGRMVAGIGVGYALMIGPVYVAELSPAMTRGLLSSFPEIFITVGILLGYIVNFSLTGVSPKYNWRIMLGLAGFPAIIVAIGVMSMPESPRWLVMNGKHDEAKRVLRKTSESDEEAETRLAEMEKAFEEAVGASANFRGQGVWKELLIKPSPAVRRILVAAIGINFFMQASGNDAVIYYTPQVLKAAGVMNKRLLMGINIVMGMSKTFFVLVSALFLDHYGRRPLLLLGTAGVAVSLFTLGVGSHFLTASHDKPAWVLAICVVSICAFLSFFSIGLGPITWVYSAEIFPMRLRAQGSSIAVSVNRVVSGVITMSFLTVAKKITFAGEFWLLSGIMVVATVFFYFVMPETKGRSLEQIQALFEKKGDDTSPKVDDS